MREFKLMTGVGPGMPMGVYRAFVMAFFLIILTGTFSVGRAFSVIRLFEVSGIPFYITDVFVLCAFPLMIIGMKALARVPRAFYLPFSALFMMGMIYFAWGVCVDRNVFALRGAVLSVYLLFLPVVWSLFSSHIRIDRFLAILVLCNIASMLLGVGVGPEALAINMRGFNLSLYYGIMTAFLLPYGMLCATGASRWLVWVLAGINFYMIIASSVRSAWVAVACLLFFYIFIFRSRLRDLLAAYGMVFLCAFGLAYAQDFGRLELGESPRYAARMEGTVCFLDDVLVPGAPAAEARNEDNKLSDRVSVEDPGKLLVAASDRSAHSLAASIAYDNITWRLKVWEATWRAGMTSPVWGHGFSRVLVYDAAISTDRVRGFGENSGIVPPHNEFLTIFYKMGLLGLALFLWINGFVFVQGVKALRRCEQGLHRACLIGALGGLVAWHVMAQFFDVIDSPPTNIFCWMLLGLVLALVYGGRDAVPGPEARA